MFVIRDTRSPYSGTSVTIYLVVIVVLDNTHPFGWNRLIRGCFFVWLIDNVIDRFVET